MDRKYKLLVASSLVSVIATGCSSYGTRGNADPQTDVTGSSGGYTSQQTAGTAVADNTVQTTANAAGRTQQWYIDQYNRNKAAGTNNGRTQQWYIDQYNREKAAAAARNTTTTSNGRTQQWYIDQYNRAQAAAEAKANQTTNGRTQQWYIDQYNRNKAAGTNNGRTQQWYIDRFNREQAAKKARQAAAASRNVAPNGRTQQWYIDQYNRNKAAGTNNGRTQQWYIDQYNREQAAKNARVATNTNGRSQQYYIDQYNRQQAAAANAARQRQQAQQQAQQRAQQQAQQRAQQQRQQQVQQQAQPANNGRSRQWYIDRFNRQQAARAAQPQAPARPAYVPPKPIVVKPYVAPAYVPPKPIVYNAPRATVAPAPATKTQTQYVDYTGGVAATAPSRPATVAAPSNKSIYTGSFQQPSTTYQQYTPRTYTGGASSGSANSFATSAATSANTAGAGTYIVKKGDTVFEVMRQTGVYWKEIISMNNLQAPSYTIQPGQALRLR